MAAVEGHDDKNSAEGSVGEKEEEREVTEKMEIEPEEDVGGEERMEAAEGGEQKEEVEDRGGNEEKGKKKRGRKPGKLKVGEEKKVSRRKLDREAKPGVERPTRERKTVERFSAMSPQSVSATKTVSIKQGSGTMLKDIPNVFYKLSKRKADENLKLLHSILFGKKAKALFLKRNICQFSGFVWSENEEKEKTKVKEKLDKVVKDKLLDFCDILDVPVSRTTMKKEDISAKLFEFLESPHATRDVILAEKEKKKKEKKKRKSRSKATGESKSSGDSEMKQKKRVSMKPENDESENGEDSEGEKPITSDDEPPKNKEKQAEKSQSESGEEEKDDSSPEKKAATKKKTGKGISATSPSKRGRPTKKQDRSKESQSGSSATGKGRASGKDKEPTKEELHAVVREILKEVDFNTATLADILKQLGTRFRKDLMHRKAEVKGIIEEVINDMTDEDDEGEAED